MKWRWDSNRMRMPILVVGQTYRRRRGSPVTILFRRRQPMHEHGGYSYRFRETGGVVCQNDFALLNAICECEWPVVTGQLPLMNEGERLVLPWE